MAVFATIKGFSRFIPHIRFIAGFFLATSMALLPLVTHAYITPGEFISGTGGGSGGTGGGSSSTGSEDEAPLPIPCLDPACIGSGSSSSTGTSNSSSVAGTTSSQTGNSSSRSVSTNNSGGTESGGGSGTDPNFILYNAAGAEVPVYEAYPPYPYYQTQEPFPESIPTLSMHEQNSGAPLANSGPESFVFLSVFGASVVFTLKQASRKKEAVAD